MKLFKIATSSILLAAIGGCSSLQLPSLEKPTNYTVNPQTGAICQANQQGDISGHCILIASIAGSLEHILPIERAYQENIKGRIIRHI